MGVTFQDLALTTLHNFFADDVYLIIRAILSYILELQYILLIFGQVSGLVCAWDKTVAAPIPAGPPPMQLWLLPWTWDEEGKASPILGVPAGETVNVEQVEMLLLEKVESRVVKLKARQLALAARITLANSLILGCLWYLLMMWAGKWCFLKKLQNIIDGFVWARRSCVTQGRWPFQNQKADWGLLGWKTNIMRSLRIS